MLFPAELIEIGLNHKIAPVPVRERLVVSASHLPNVLRALRDMLGVVEVAIVSTCNRLEIYAAVDEAASRQAALVETLAELRGLGACEFTCYLYTHVGEPAARHLFRVATGLDSLPVGEHQILGQVKDAFQAAQDAGAIGDLLSGLLRQAITTGKRARNETEIGRGARSLGQVAVSLARETLGDLNEGSHRVARRRGQAQQDYGACACRKRTALAACRESHVRARGRGRAIARWSRGALRCTRARSNGRGSGDRGDGRAARRLARKRFARGDGSACSASTRRD